MTVKLQGLAAVLILLGKVCAMCKRASPVTRRSSPEAICWVVQQGVERVRRLFQYAERQCLHSVHVLPSTWL